MPFPSSWIEEKLQASLHAKRLAHAYLLSGDSLEELQRLFESLAQLIIREPIKDHPDVHIVQPRSKSRRIVIEQIRRLEQPLALKPYRAPYKVACIVAAERMCMGSAEPANAFLKTLEEPPDQTVIFLLTENPEALLPTIISRCLWLPVKMQEQVAVDEHTQIAVDAWFNVFAKHPADRAYMRASAVALAWSEKRMALDQAYKESARKASSETESELEEDADEKVVDAQLESDFIQWRERVLKQILRHDQNQELPLAQRQRVIECIEELRQALGRNLDPAFALERCCLKLEGLIA